LQDKVTTSLTSQKRYSNEPIAVIGLSCVFPGAKNHEEYWQRLCQGDELITYFSPEELAQQGVSSELLQDPHYVMARGIIEEVDCFDADFFHITPKEALRLDPQQRLFLQHAWWALETAGYCPKKYSGRIGIFSGADSSEYFEKILHPFLQKVSQTDTLAINLARMTQSFLSTKTSYHLGTTGPSININTACSTGLVVVDVACQYLRSGYCEIALAGAVSIKQPQKIGYLYQKEGITSPDGHCRAFDEQAAGTVPSSGLGILVLKRLSEAIQDGDMIWSVIKGIAVNNDGDKKIGFTAPNASGQERCIREALQQAGIPADTIDYVETHGTATALGDPIEINALMNAFAEVSSVKKKCAIGSVKTNLGHADAAAGMAGIIKTILMLYNAKIPPTLHYHRNNPQIDFSKAPFYVNTTLKVWSCPQENPRRAGVSAFGIGGTNAHVVLEEGPPLFSREKPSIEGLNQIIILSAKSEQALATIASGLSHYLQRHAPQEEDSRSCFLADVAYTLQVGRSDFLVRRAIVCQTLTEAITALKNHASATIHIVDPQCSTNQENQIDSVEVSEEQDPQRIAALWLSGERINWRSYHSKSIRRKLPLPTYPFEKQRYWPHGQFTTEKNSSFELNNELIAETDLTRCLYQMTWQRLESLEEYLTITTSPIYFQKKYWLVLCNQDVFSDRLVSVLNSTDCKVIRVHAAAQFKRLSEKHYEVDAVDRHSYQQLLSALSEDYPQITEYSLVHCWGLMTGEVPEPCYCFYSLVELARAATTHFLSISFSTLVIQSHVQSVLASDPVIPEKATVLGACQVIPLEFPQFHIMNLDLLESEWLEASDTLIHSVIRQGQECSESTDSRQYAYRGGYRWQKGTRKQSCLDLEKTPQCEIIKNDGVYLITGGLGGMGLSLAKFLSGISSAHIVLLSRRILSIPEQQWASWLASTSPNDSEYEAIKGLHELKRKVASFSLWSANVACEREMCTVISKIEKQCGTITGIIHAAGLPASGPIQCFSKQEMEQVLAPKVAGTKILAKLFKNKPLDFVVLCSSLTSWIGGVGQSDYCAANACLDAFANANAFHPKTFVTTINWNGWWQVGMQARASSKNLVFSTTSMADRIRKNVLTVQQGEYLLASILQRKLKQVLISVLPLTVLRKTVRRNRLKKLVVIDSLQKENLNQPPDSVAHITSIFQTILGVASINENDDFFTLGGDSLAALSLIDLLEKKYHVSLSLSMLHQLNTSKKLADFIKQPASSSHSETVVLLNSEGEEPPLFLIHPVGGAIICFEKLARTLRGQRTCYALQDLGLMTVGYDFRTLEAMASYYVRCIQAIQPKGPYSLVGYSMGGTIAVEMARQLQQVKETVTLLGLIDSWALFTDQFRDEVFFKHKMRIQLRSLQEQYGSRIEINKIESHLQCQWQRMRLLLRYQPPLLNNKIILFKAIDLLPEYIAINESTNHSLRARERRRRKASSPR